MSFNWRMEDEDETEGDVEVEWNGLFWIFSLLTMRKRCHFYVSAVRTMPSEKKKKSALIVC